jgi:hypothetical protein
MPTDEEAHESWQDGIFDSACHLVRDRMTNKTRQRFFTHIKESYANEI